MPALKLDRRQYEQYWADVHRQTSEGLAAVCFPDKPLYFNRFFDRTQKWVVDRYIREHHAGLGGARVLDIGCGRGRWLRHFQERHGAQVTGIELSDVAVESCRADGFDVRLGSIEALPFDDESFDFLSSITVLLHLPSEIKQKAVTEIARVVKRGGRVMLLESTWHDPAPHVFGLQIREWDALFSDAGLHLIHRSGHCFNIVRRTLPERVPFHDFISISLDYPIEFALNAWCFGKETRLGLQHLMVFEKR